MSWIPQFLCGPCGNGECTGPGFGGICEHECHKVSNPEGVPSLGGKEFTVKVSGDEVELNWSDEAVREFSGDALFTPDDSIRLGEKLIEAGRAAKRGQG